MLKIVAFTLFLVMAVLAVSAQDQNFRLNYEKMNMRSPKGAEVVGMSLMSVGGCMLGLPPFNSQPEYSFQLETVQASGLVLVVSGFITYLVGSIRHNEEAIYKGTNLKK